MRVDLVRLAFSAPEGEKKAYPKEKGRKKDSPVGVPSERGRSIGCFVLVGFNLAYFFLGLAQRPHRACREWLLVGMQTGCGVTKKAETKKKGRLAPSFTVVLPFLSLSLHSAFFLGCTANQAVQTCAR